MELKTIEFFKEIAKIPRESGHEEKIAQYLCNFAEERGLFYDRDAYQNVLIKKKTANKEVVILQAHTDMVCEKEANVSFDFATDSIEVIQEDGYLRANGTTLGADNGIGVALILAILDSDIPCNIEAVFTSSEETSMTGAIHFDTSKLEGKQLLNLDGFNENTILVESACFYDIILSTSYNFQKHTNGKIYTVQLKGLPGGHSGTEIDKETGNSNIELAMLLNQFEGIELIHFVGGTKFNVIPSYAEASFYSTISFKEMKQQCQVYESKLQRKFPQAKLALQEMEGNEKALNVDETRKFIQSIIRYKHGVFKRNERNEPTTSMNLGVVNLQEQVIKIGMRSSRKAEEQECLEWIKTYSQENGLCFQILGHQPGFHAKEKSLLVKKLLTAHPIKLFQGKKPKIQSVHITVEVGFFQEKIPNLEIAIISADVREPHTPRECVTISSIQRLNKWVLQFLEQT